MPSRAYLCASLLTDHNTLRKYSRTSDKGHSERGQTSKYAHIHRKLTSYLSSCYSVGVEFILLVAETLSGLVGCYHLMPPRPPSTFSGMSPLLFGMGMQVYGCDPAP